MDERELIYDWNFAGERWERPGPIQLDDETLRDGLQSPSVRTPTADEKIRILHLMDRLGIDTADVGLPGAGPHVVHDVTLLVREIRDARLSIRPNCAARTLRQDITPIVELSQQVGISIEVCTFIGSSPIRQYAEGWTLDTMLRHTEAAVTLAVNHGLPVMYVTEDTVRAQPQQLRRLFLAAIRCGAQRLCLCDTVGHATPAGAANLVRFARQVVLESGADVGLDWHGHCDRGLAVANTIAAIQAGAARAARCARGGRKQEIEVGPMSGESNVVYWLETHGFEATPERVKAVFERAKSVDRVLTEVEIRGVLDALDPSSVS